MSNLNNNEFKINDFTGFLATVQYAGLLRQKKTGCDNNGKLVHYIDLKDKNHIERFLNHMEQSVTDNLCNVSALAKVLYQCNRDEVDEQDINMALGVIVALSDINAWIYEEIREMTADNTFPLR